MIPDWNFAAVLSPIRPGQPGNSPDRSPFITSLVEVIERFARSRERLEILRGLFHYRAALRKSGIAHGFQWLDGSFMEHKEALVGAPPKDIDVVTFFYLPPGANQADFADANKNLFIPESTKKQYHVDAYGFLLGDPLAPFQVRQISYWYSMWSHRRSDYRWKGFVQIDISAQEDDLAKGLLDQLESEGRHL